MSIESLSEGLSPESKKLTEGIDELLLSDQIVGEVSAEVDGLVYGDIHFKVKTKRSYQGVYTGENRTSAAIDLYRSDQESFSYLTLECGERQAPYLYFTDKKGRSSQSGNITVALIAFDVSSFINNMIFSNNPESQERAYKKIRSLLDHGIQSYTSATLSDPTWNESVSESLLRAVERIPAQIEAEVYENDAAIRMHTRILSLKNDSQEIEFIESVSKQPSDYGSIVESRVKTIKVSSYKQSFIRDEQFLLKETQTLILDGETLPRIRKDYEDVSVEDYDLNLPAKYLPTIDYPIAYFENAAENEPEFLDGSIASEEEITVFNQIIESARQATGQY